MLLRVLLVAPILAAWIRHIHLPGGIGIGFGVATHIAIGVHAGQVALYRVRREKHAHHRVVVAGMEVV